MKSESHLLQYPVFCPENGSFPGDITLQTAVQWGVFLRGTATFFCCGDIMYPIRIQLEAGKWARPFFSVRTHFFMDWVLYMVLKKMDLVFILASPILVLTKVVMKYLVFCFLFF